MNDEHYMEIAINLAKSIGNQTSPNPNVGCIIVKDGLIIGMGAHLKSGEGHAEVLALNMAQEKAINSTVYVTLEPCNHTGLTPPCTEALINAEVKRVVIAETDPNPLVTGKGVNRLREAGIEVNIGIPQNKLEGLNEFYRHYMVHKKPYITLKTAISLDGKIATYSGDSKWITGKDSRNDVHMLRNNHDAIIVGVNTVIKDDPKLTVRLKDRKGRNPIRVVLDSNLRIPINASLLHDGKSKVIIFTTTSINQVKKEQLQEIGVEVIQTTSSTTKVNLEEALHILGTKKITSALLESGSELNAAFLKANLVNKIITYIAPKIIGGKSSIPSFGGEEIQTLSNAKELSIQEVMKIGNDLKIVSVPI